MDFLVTVLWVVISSIIPIITRCVLGMRGLAKALTDLIAVSAALPLVYLALITLVVPTQQFVSIWVAFVADFVDGLAPGWIGYLIGTLIGYVLCRHD